MRWCFALFAKISLNFVLLGKKPIAYLEANMKQNSVSNKRAKLAECEPQDEVVITGISGVYPKSNNVSEFGENLLAKKNLISDTDEQFKAGAKIFCKLTNF